MPVELPASPIGREVHGKVVRLTLDHPPVNAMSPALLATLEAALATVETSADCAVLVVASTQRVFSAGGDIAAMADWLAGPDPGTRFGAYARAVQRVFDRLEALPIPTIAEIDGAALGGGLELALACDFRVASRRARFGLPELTLGLLPAAGGTQRLTRLCGSAVAKRMILGTEIVAADEALRLGLVHQLADDDTVGIRCRELAARLEALPRRALERAKQCIGAAFGDPAAGYRMEANSLAELAGEADTLPRFAAFLDASRRRP